MVTASRTALARTALTAVPLTRALALAQWAGAILPVPISARTAVGHMTRRTSTRATWRRHHPSDEEHQRMLEWLGLEDPSDFDPAAFDLASVNARLHGIA
jgi:predicted deacylase